MQNPERSSRSTGGNYEDIHYRSADEISAAVQWAIQNLGSSEDNTITFEVMLQAIKQRPDLFIQLVTGSNKVAREVLGQEREGKSPATMLGTIDAAIKVVAHQKRMFPGESAFTGESWTPETMITVLSEHMPEVIRMAGSNTTAKNLPHRAASLLWMIDKSEGMPENPEFAFLELGSSRGLILDGVRTPDKFDAWMKAKGHNIDVAHVFAPGTENATLGVDLVIPELDWLKALLLEDSSREQTIEFINSFPRSKIVQGDATRFRSIPDVNKFFDQHRDKIPFIYCTSVLYQLTNEKRAQVISGMQSMLQALGGGYMMVSDYGPNRGYPAIDKNVAWIEDEQGRAVSPKIHSLTQNATKWSVIEE